MAISNVRILDTMGWVKRFSFNRQTAIGNSLEPAKTAAQIVMQTILGPPFCWWWNTQELSFITSPTPAATTLPLAGTVAITGNVLTIDSLVGSPFVAGQIVTLSGFTTATFLNGVSVVLLTATSTSMTAVFIHADYASAVDTGTITGTTTQDYTIPAPNFSHIEHASLLDTTKTPNKWYELKVQNNLALDSVIARPEFIGPEVEDAAGNVTFRLMPSPNAAFPVNIHAQLAAPQITSVLQTWAPIPDFMQYIYSWGFLALIWAFADDARFPMANSKFTSGILARADGITEEERNIWLNNWDALTGRQQMNMQQGTQARQN